MVIPATLTVALIIQSPTLAVAPSKIATSLAPGTDAPLPEPEVVDQLPVLFQLLVVVATQ